MIEKVVVCPFDAKHIMLESSLQRHVIKCMLKHPGWLVCPFNALHRSKDEEALRRHTENCDSKLKMECFENTKQYSSSHNSVRVDNEPLYYVDRARNFNLEYEDWDAEINPKQ